MHVARQRVKLIDFHFSRSDDNRRFTASALFVRDGVSLSVTGQGNGRLSAVVDALRRIGVKVHVESYSEHALGEGSRSRAAAYVGISGADGGVVWGRRRAPRHHHRFDSRPDQRREPPDGAAVKHIRVHWTHGPSR